MKRRLPTLVVLVAAIAVVAAAGLLATIRFVVQSKFDRQGAELSAELSGMPADKAIDVMAARGRRFTEAEAQDLDFPQRPPQGRYEHFWVDVLMVRIDHRDNVVLQVETRKIEFR